jgi:molybdate transport system substrate-binding protein
LRIDDLDDLAALPEGNRISLCALSAACGRVAELLLGDAGVVVDERRVSRGPDVTTTAAAVRRGDAAVALVFRTDARAAGDEVTEVPIVGVESRTVEALAAALRNSPNLDLARRFVGLVASPTGQEVLTDAGFGPA